MKKVLIIDDERATGELLTDFFYIEGFQIVIVKRSEEGIALLEDGVDCVLLDMNTEGKNGIQICKEIRKISDVPVLFMSGNSTQADKLLGLGVGADDYITKPFDPLEVVARVKANIRRSERFSNKAKEVIHFDDITLYLKNYKAYRNDVEIKLSSKEFLLLHFFVVNKNIVVSREQILNAVWGNNYYNENVVNTTVKRLRDKLDDTHQERYIKTMRNLGYLFDAESNQSENDRQALA